MRRNSPRWCPRRHPAKNWVHEIKFDGYRLVAVAAYRQAELFTRAAIDWSERFKPLCAAFAKLRRSFPRGAIWKA